MVDAVFKIGGLFLGLVNIGLYKSTETVSDIIIEPTIDLTENIEIFFHKEKTFGLVFLFIVIVIVLSYKLKK